MAQCTDESITGPIFFTIESRDRHKRYARDQWFVIINCSSHVMRSQGEYTAIDDCRIASARRLNGQDAAQCGLLAFCVALDAALKLFNVRLIPCFLALSTFLNVELNVYIPMGT